MTGTGDGLNLDFLNEPDPQPQTNKPGEPVQVEEIFDVPSPLGSLEGLLCKSEKNDDRESEAYDGASIFDDGPEGPINSFDGIPDAIPNISDEGTEILSHGRVEIQDFTEEFAAEDTPSSLGSDQSDPEVPGDYHGNGASPDTLGGLLLTDLADAEDSPTVIFGGRPVEPPIPETGVDGSLPPEMSLMGFESSLEPLIESSDVRTVDSSSESAIDIIEDEDEGVSLSDVTSSAVAETTVGTPTPRPQSSSAPSGNRTILLALGGYALVVSALCVLLLSLLAKARNASRLESLPDLPPEPPKQMTLIPVNAELPPGHTLSLGESQRFGNLRVEPLKVTRGPVQFAGSGNTQEEGFKTDPVLMLWVKLTNESKDQAFAPLDGDLLFRRSRDGERSNNFVIEKSDKPQGSPCVLVHYDELLKSGEWTLAGQQLGQTLQPGESLETFIPTVEENIDRLTGDLLWRIQLRKGRSPSGGGVTTLVEVAFPANQIQPDGT